MEMNTPGKFLSFIATGLLLVNLSLAKLMNSFPHQQAQKLLFPLQPKPRRQHLCHQKSNISAITHMLDPFLRELLPDLVKALFEMLIFPQETDLW